MSADVDILVARRLAGVALQRAGNEPRALAVLSGFAPDTEAEIVAAREGIAFGRRELVPTGFQRLIDIVAALVNIAMLGGLVCYFTRNALVDFLPWWLRLSVWLIVWSSLSLRIWKGRHL